MSGLYRLLLRVLTMVFVFLPFGLWAWTALTVSLVCALDESSSTCADPNAGFGLIGFLKLALISWALAAACAHLGKRMDARLKEEA